MPKASSGAASGEVMHDLRPRPAAAQSRGGEDRQLVERQRPEGAEGYGERDRAAVARLHGVERGADGGGVAPAAEGDRPGEARATGRAPTQTSSAS